MKKLENYRRLRFGVLLLSLFAVIGCNVSPAEIEVEDPEVDVEPGYRWLSFRGTTYAHAPAEADDTQGYPPIWQFGPDQSGVHHYHDIGFQVCADAENTDSFEEWAEAFADGCEEYFTQAGVDDNLNLLYGSNWAVIDADVQWDWRYWSTFWDDWQVIPDDWFYSKCYETYLDDTWSQHIDFYGDTDTECTAEQAANHAIRDLFSDKSYNAAPSPDSYADIAIRIDDDTILRPDEPFGMFTNQFTYGFDTETKCDSGICPLTLGSFDGHVWNAIVTNDHGSASIEDIKFSLHERPTGTYNATTKSASFATDEVSILLRYTYAGTYTNAILKNKEPMEGTLDPDGNSFSFGGVFGDADVTLEIHFEGTYSHVPPTAVINAPETAECTGDFHADVLVDGTSYPIAQPKDHFWWVKGETGIYIPQHVDENIVTVRVPVGDSIIRHKVVDSKKIWDVTEATISVVDTTPPEIVAPEQVHQVCVPNNAVVDLQIPSVTDACTDDTDVELNGFIKTMNGLDAGMNPIVGNSAILPLGETIIVWKATDEFGNETEVEQTIIVQFEISEECCETYQTFEEGTDWADSFYLTGGPKCVLSYAGQDYVYAEGDTCSSPGGDFVALGTDGDYMFARPCDAIIVGQEGADFIYCSDEGDVIYAGDGGDNISCPEYSGSNTIFAGYGDDFIYGAGGADTIYPGHGVDVVYGRQGNDTVIIYHECELSPGKQLYGGSGNDTLYLPVSESEAISLGVIISGFENILLTDSTLAGLSDCVAETFSDPGTGTNCVGVEEWSSAQGWWEYSVGDRKVNNNQLWECHEPAWAYLEPSGAYGYLGWTFVSFCD